MARYNQQEMIVASVSEEEKRRIGNIRKASSDIRNNNLDEGVITFALWLNAEDKKSPTIPIALKEFTEGRRVVLQDNNLQKEVIINIVEGAPFCNECRSNDCAHVGFVICTEQLTNRSKIE
jgi:hypothetical protein